MNDLTSPDKKAGEAYAELHRVVARLRAPDGCPWDREQTPQSLRGDLVEEAYELVEAIGEGEASHICEEAGDLILVATMIAYMHEEKSLFSVADSLRLLSEKLIRRHPHVFGEAEASTSEEVLVQWAAIKETVEGRRKKDSLMDEVSQALPTLERAYKLQKKAAKAGFDWADARGALGKLREEIEEVAEVAEGPLAAPEKGPRLEEEIGDLLFSVVNLSRKFGIDPGLALAGANDKFARRFRHVERRMAETGQAMGPGALEVMDGFWEEAKAGEKAPR